MTHLKNRDGNKPRREDRKLQAADRQLAASQRTPAERLARLGTLTAKKERAKLAKLLPAEVTPAKASQASKDAPGTTQAPAPVSSPQAKKTKAQKGA